MSNRMWLCVSTRPGEMMPLVSMIVAPIAALALRARNAKSPKERHDLAYFAWEASVRLAVAMGPADASKLAVPSTGDWVAALPRDERVLDDPALLAAQKLFVEEGLGRG